MSQVQAQRHPLVLAGIVIFITGILAAAAWGLNSVTNPQPTATAATTVCAKAPTGHPNPKPVRSHPQPPTVKLDPAMQYFATMCTARGLIVFKFRTDTAPITSGNFIALADSGFFDGLNFHRVCPNSADQSCGDGSLKIAQGGDPKGDGTGGPGYSIADEGPKGPYTAGSFAMARSTQVSGSQFFINTADNSAILSPQPQVYNLFADITQGLDVAQSLKKGDTMFWVAISRVPLPSPSPSAAPEASPAPSPSDTSAPSPAPS